MYGKVLLRQSEIVKQPAIKPKKKAGTELHFLILHLASKLNDALKLNKT